MISQWLMSYWFWFILALVFLFLEIFVSGFYLIWFAVGAFVAGVVKLFFPQLHLYFPLMVFSLTSVASVVVWKLYDKRWPQKTDRPLLNQRGQTYLGRVVPLDAPIVAGQGRIRLDDSVWLVNGPDLPAKTWVKIVAVAGSAITVCPVEDGADDRLNGGSAPL